MICNLDILNDEKNSVKDQAEIPVFQWCPITGYELKKFTLRYLHSTGMQGIQYGRPHGAPADKKNLT